MLVYIVDDNLDMCEFISYLLSNEGYDTHAFSCPVEALNHMQEHQHQPDLLISDYNMPKMNGYELYKAVKNIVSDLKAIIISGRSQHDMAETTLSFSFLQKPFTPEQMTSLIKQLHSS